MNDLFNTIKVFNWLYQPLKKKAKTALLIAFLMIIISSFIASLVPKLIGETIDHIITNNKWAYTAIAVIAGLFVFDIISEVIRKYLIETTATQTQKDLIVKTSEHLIELDINWLNEQRSGGLNGKIQRSVEGAVELLKLITRDFLPNIFQMVFAVLIAFFTNIYIGCILLVVICLGLYIVLRQITSQKGIRLSLLKAREDNDANIVELLTGIESVRVANEEKKQIKRIDAVNEHLRKVELKHHYYMMFFDSIKKINIVVWNIVILLVGVYLASTGHISTGEVVTFNLLFNNILIPLQNIHRFIDEAHESSLKTEDLQEILNLPIDESYHETEKENNYLPKVETPWAIKVKDLSFKYKEENVLNHITITFDQGKYYGIIGATGCGKSTLIRIIMNLIHYDSGHIYIYGKEIKQISREQLSSHIIFMPQTPFIFSGTIRENILFGSKFTVSDDDIWESLEKACLKKDVQDFPDQLDFRLNERGTNLSGGQRQRVALARVFLSIHKLKTEHIIILDEATSALDMITEKIIMDNLFAFMDNKTTIIAIAHRYSTLEKADSIIVMKKGTVQQIITYKDLKEIEHS